MPAASQPVLKEFNLRKILRVSSQRAIRSLVKNLGDKVYPGELVAFQKSFLGEKSFFSPVKGILDSMTEEGILRIKQFPPKKKKIESPDLKRSAVIKANWGWGGRAAGMLNCLESQTTVFDLGTPHQGQILALNSGLEKVFWHKANSLGVAGLICTNLADPNLAETIKKETVLIDGKRKEFVLPLVTIGEKTAAEIWPQLASHHGKKIFIEGSKKRILIPRH